jgi:hypothetical protein
VRKSRAAIAQVAAEIVQSVEACSFVQARTVDMKITTLLSAPMFSLLLATSIAYAGEYDATIELFKHAGESAVFFSNCYGYAVFPTVGAGGLVVGGARGKGQVYVFRKQA